MNYSKETILITGSAGSIGSALARTIAKKNPKKLLLLDQNETGVFDLYHELKDVCKVDYFIASIRDWSAIHKIFCDNNPTIVYHAAAYKHVGPMEKFPEEAFKTNVEGLGNVADSAMKSGVKKFVFISSDKAVNPTCVMGKTKKTGEMMCLGYNSKTKFIVVRFGNVMPSQGSVVPIFNKQISEGKNLTVTSPNMKRYFMGIYDAVRLVIKASQIGQGGEIFILPMGAPIYIKDLAKLMIKLSGKDLDIEYTEVGKGEKTSEELMTKEERKRSKMVDELIVIYGRQRILV